LVGNAIETENFDDSRLYAKDYDRRYRPQNARSFIGNEKE
jgi:precorrin-4/cobalt-precorrin-4 C11-methyltransferase